MRVIGGEFRSRVLKSVRGLETRPTPDRLRETLFNIVAPRIRGVAFLDLYAGTGAVGIEALSRGARQVVMIENNRAALQVIRENVRSLGIEARADVRQGHASSMIPLIDADIVFLDPPYRDEHEYEAAFAALAAKLPALVVAQHSSKVPLAESYGSLRRTRVLKQGDNALSFYEPGSKDAPERT